MGKCRLTENCTEQNCECSDCFADSLIRDKEEKKKKTTQRSDCRKTFSDNKRLRKENSRLKKQNQKLKSMIGSMSNERPEQIEEKLSKRIKEKRKQSIVTCPNCGNPADEIDLGHGRYVICEFKECNYRGKI